MNLINHCTFVRNNGCETQCHNVLVCVCVCVCGGEVWGGIKGQFPPYSPALSQIMVSKHIFHHHELYNIIKNLKELIRH